MKKSKLPYHQDSGFSVPQRYFEELERDLLNMAQSSANRQDTLLDQVESTGFKVPDGYFDSVETELLQKIRPEPGVIPLFKKEYLLYAASIAVIIFALAGSLLVDPSAAESWESIELSVLENYIDNNHLDFSTLEISGFLFEEGDFIEDSGFTDVNPEAMFNYLDENVEDPSFIFD